RRRDGEHGARDEQPDDLRRVVQRSREADGARGQIEQACDEWTGGQRQDAASESGFAARHLVQRESASTGQGQSTVPEDPRLVDASTVAAAPGAIARRSPPVTSAPAGSRPPPPNALTRR